MKLRVCELSEVPEDGMAAFDVDGLTTPVLVVRHGGEVFAVSGMCPHEDVELAGGDVEDIELIGGGRRLQVVCPGHGYCFDVRSGACIPDDRLELPRYRTAVENGVVYVDPLVPG